MHYHQSKGQHTSASKEKPSIEASKGTLNNLMAVGVIASKLWLFLKCVQRNDKSWHHRLTSGDKRDSDFFKLQSNQITSNGQLKEGHIDFGDRFGLKCGIVFFFMIERTGIL
ncbi:hypothetical protein ACJX0J_028741, partial [Zea mays]